MLRNTFIRNKQLYLAYNKFRKGIFRELAPKDADDILFLLPWMFSVNNPAVPGYIENLAKPISLYGSATDPELLKRDAAFKKRFGMTQPHPLLKPYADVCLIQGLYTIGSAGTISQTAASDCDIWVCIEKSDFCQTAREQLLQKINLIKDWCDSHLKMPVYFFLCCLDDIRNAYFGGVGDESCGSSQGNVLKEEFYRTAIQVAGRIPLWWVCFDPDSPADYPSLVQQYAQGALEDYDFVDMGEPGAVASDEYFGAALWQINKALTHPLKSVMKMLLLEMLLESDGKELLCQRFRDLILGSQAGAFTDPSLFTLDAILDFNRSRHAELYEFIKQCGYLRYGVHFYAKRTALKESLARQTFKVHPLDKEEIIRLNAFADWPLWQQMDFGEKIFFLLLQIYKRIMACQTGQASRISQQDMSIIGRKLAVCLEKKEFKLPLVHKPLAAQELPNLIFMSGAGGWRALAAGDASRPVVAAGDLVYVVAYLVWNGLYAAANVRMTPNPTPVTLQEIHNLARRIRELFGAFDVTGIDFDHFQEQERVTKLLVVVSFEDPRRAIEMNDFSVLYLNHWGELFCRSFHTPFQFKKFIDQGGALFSRTETHYYIQRSSLYYEKTIERSKKLVTQVFSGVTDFR